MAIDERAHQAGVYRVAERALGRVLRSNGSLHTGDRIWAPDLLADLSWRFEDRFPTSSGGFDERWRMLLEGAAPKGRRLAAEVMCLHLLFPSDIAGATKRRLLSTTDPTLRLPGWIDLALDAGVTTTGIAYKAARLSQLGFIVRAVRAWKALPAAERRARSANAAEFRAWLHGIPPEGGHAQREALLHLLFPDAFEPIVSTGVKHRIVEAFAEHVSDPSVDVDTALREIRASLQPTYGSGFRFDDPAVAQRWKPGGST